MKHKFTLAIVMVISIAMLATHVAASGSLLIQSIPTNASVKLDGVQMQNTPVLANPLTAGQHTLELTLAGYLPYAGNVTVVDNIKTDVTITLTPIPATTGVISINSNPSNAAIILNGTDYGYTPRTIADLAPGIYTVNLTLNGYQPYSNNSVQVKAGEVTPLAVTLIPSTTYGNAAFTSVPSGATIRIDGTDTHLTTNGTVFFIPAGQHNFTLSFPGYYDYTGSITVIADQTITVPTAVLVPLPSPGNIYVSTIPDGASIFIDGGYNGTTPKMLTLPGTLGGTQYTMKLTKSLYRNWTGQITVYAGQTVTYPQVALEPVPTYLLVSTSGAGGNIDPLGQVTAYEGQDLAFTITAFQGYHIANFTVDGVINTTPVASPFVYTFTNITAPHSISALFAPDIFTLTPSAGSGGSISPSTPQQVVYGSTLPFVITADTGHRIANVTIDGVVDSSPKPSPYTHTFSNITADHTIDAQFAIDTFTITPGAGDGGSIEPSEPQTVAYGDSSSFVITADEGYKITSITIDGTVNTTPVESPYTYTFRGVDANHTITAQFAIQTFRITPAAGPGGSIRPSEPQTVRYGASVPFQIIADEGYNIANITIDDVVNSTPLESPYTHTFEDVDANHTITAQFSEKTFVIAVTVEGQGTVTPKGNVTVPYKGTQVFHVVPESGYYNDRLIADGVDKVHDITGGSYKFENVTANHTLVVTFIPPPKASFTASPPFGTVPLTVKFNNTSPNPITDFFWDFGDGEYSGDFSPLHTYNKAGNFTAYLVVQNKLLNMTSVASKNITVVTYPVARFTGAPTRGSVPLLVQFQDLSDGKPSRWLWQFGDGGQSTKRNPYHLYENPGTYTVRLTIANRAGVNSVAAYEFIVATQKPVASFMARKTSGPAPLSVQFNDTSTGNPQKWAWKFGDGEVSEEQDPLHIFKNPGVYSVTLTVNNDIGTSTTTEEAYVTVTEKPVAYFTADPTEGDAPLVVQFTDRSTGNPSQFYWTFGDGAASNQKDPIHIFSKPGVYAVNHTVLTPEGSFLATDTVTVTQAQQAEFNGDPVRGTAPLTVSFTDLSKGSPEVWKWNFGDNTISSDRNPVHTYQKTGVFNVSLTTEYKDATRDTVVKPYYIEVLSPV